MYLCVCFMCVYVCMCVSLVQLMQQAAFDHVGITPSSATTTVLPADRTALWLCAHCGSGYSKDEIEDMLLGDCERLIAAFLLQVKF
jgi:hypothetical protein